MIPYAVTQLARKTCSILSVLLETRKRSWFNIFIHAFYCVKSFFGLLYAIENSENFSTEEYYILYLFLFCETVRCYKLIYYEAVFVIFCLQCTVVKDHIFWLTKRHERWLKIDKVNTLFNFESMHDKQIMRVHIYWRDTRFINIKKKL